MGPQHLKELKELEEKIRAYIDAHPDRLGGVKFGGLKHKEKHKDPLTGSEVPQTIVATAHIEIGTKMVLSDLADSQFNHVMDVAAETICKAFERLILRVGSGH